MSRAGKLAPEVNRALFVKNLSYNVTPEDLFELFGKFGPIRQVRQGIATNTKGTAFVVYEDVMDAKQACDKLNGFNFQGRYLVVLYHQPEKMMKSKEDLEARKENLAQLKQKHGIDCQLDGPAGKFRTTSTRRTSADPSISSNTTTTSSPTSSIVKPPSPLKMTTTKQAKAGVVSPATKNGPPDEVAEHARKRVVGFVRGFLPQKTSNKMVMT